MRPTGGVVSAPRPQIPLKLLPSALNQNENQPEPVGPAHVARTLSFVRNLPLIANEPVWQTTAAFVSEHFISPTNAVGPPAPITFQVPAAVIGDGGRISLPTNDPFAARP